MTAFIVTSAADSGAGSLREAVALANAHAGADTITFAASFNGEAQDLIRLTSGQITITDALTITGGAQGVRITGDADGDDVLDADGYTDVARSLAAGADRLSDNTRVFAITGASSVTTLENLQITGGRTTAGNGPGAAPNTQGGGGINSQATLTLRNSEVSGNSTSGYKAAGGGIAGTDLVLEGSTLAGNATSGNLASGGGFAVSGHASLTNSTLAANTLTGRYANGGGGYAYATMTLLHATVTANAVYTDFLSGDGFVATAGLSTGFGTITNSIVSGNGTRAGIFGSVTGDTGVATDILPGPFSPFILVNSLVGGDPGQIFANATLLPKTATWYSAGVEGGVLAASGGIVRTVGIAPGSLAQDAGGPTTLATDQRGDPRTVGAAPDAGAVEIRDTPSLVVTTARDVVDGSDGLTSLREAVAYANAKAGADRITFDQAVFNGEAADVIRLLHDQIDITDALTIDGGPGRPVITGDAAGNDVLTAEGLTDIPASRAAGTLGDNHRLFFIAESAGQAELANLTLTGGNTATRFTDANFGRRGFEESLNLDDSGAAVWTLSDLTLTGVTVIGNQGRRGPVTGGDAVQAYAPRESSPYIVPATLTTADITITGSRIERNLALSSNGAAVATFGNIALADSILRDNGAFGVITGLAGPGFAFRTIPIPASIGTIIVTDSLIEGNTRGAVRGRDVTIVGSSIIGNGLQTPEYGAPSLFTIHGTESVLLVNSTVVGNAFVGPGATIAGRDLDHPGSMTSATLINSTVTGNVGDNGGAIQASVVTLTNSIVVANLKFFDPFGSQIVAGALTNNNSIVTPDGRPIFAATVEVAPGIFAGVLADNGGPARTVALLADPANPALDAAGPGASATDQRGVTRADLLPGGGVADLGAFELPSLQADMSLTGDAGANLLIGGTGKDVLRGGAGGDSLVGLGGDDSLLGDGGADSMRGGAGNDVYAVDDAGDRVTEAEGGGTDRVVARISYTLGDWVENLTLAGAAALDGTGNGLANVIIGNSGANRLSGAAGDDTIRGGAGADSMDGGAGNDLSIVDDAGDRVTETAGGGTDRVVASVSHALDAWVENLTLAGTAALNGTGNALANVINGNAGANQLRGGLGADRLTGGGGGDAFVFGSATEGADRITDFTHGEDQIWLSAAGFGGLLTAGALDAALLRIGPAATLPGPQVIYNPANGRLSWDADGTGPGTASLLAILLNTPAGFDASDILVVG